jgi:CO/xanthine dehydrogenase Mo-binding subunit
MIVKGKGMALCQHTAGAKGNGDPDQAHIRIKNDGTFDLAIVTEELGQGCLTVFNQIAAETLDVDVSKITVKNNETDTGGFGFVTGGSRSTFITGNAVIRAAQDLLRQLKETAAQILDVPEENLVIEGEKIFKKDDESVSTDFATIAATATYGMEKYLFGKGNYMYMAPQPMDKDTGECQATAAISYVAGVAEIEVDTETGLVDVKKLYSSYEVGRVMNPTLLEGQVLGGDSMALGMALYENMCPVYPEMDFQPRGFTDYIIPTAVDMPESIISFVDNPDPDGPYGAKGAGEIVVNWQPAAIVNAVYDALGIWIDTMPVTPEKILRALEEKAAQ